MMLNIAEAPIPKGGDWLSPRAWLGPAFLSTVLAGELVFILAKGGTIRGLTAASPKQVGVALYGPYMLGAELASLLLLAALVGAFHLGRKLATAPERRED